MRRLRAPDRRGTRLGAGDRRVLRSIPGVALLDGIEDFVGLLDQVGSEGRVSLFAVPGAAAGGAQAGLDGDEIFKRFADVFCGWICGGVLRFGFVGAQTLGRFFGGL